MLIPIGRSAGTIFGRGLLLGEFVEIRDRILVDAKLQAKLDKSLAASDAVIVTLIARVIEHEPGFVLKLPGYFVRLFAADYDARGGAVDVADKAGIAGAAGATGAPGLATHTINRKGGAGGRGATGGAGGAAGSIDLMCQRVHGVRLQADGAAGGNGGDGGAGGRGGNGLRQSPRFDGFAGSGGGAGGQAGNGGNGGAGGRILLSFVAADNPQAIAVSAAAGVGGAPGVRGQGGKKGTFSEDPDGARGAAGRAGAPGRAGKAEAVAITDADYWTRTAVQLGAKKTGAWADYRLEVGIYFYRLYRPDAANQGWLGLAMAEFDAVLKLRPGDPIATRYQRQILAGQNVLGLAVELDIIPDFEVEFADYKSSAEFVANFYNQGITLLLAGENKAASVDQLTLKAMELQDRITIDTDDREAAQRGSEGAQKAYTHAVARVNELSAQITVAAAKKPDTSISIGTIVSTVAAVGAAVVSVIAAVPTGGASLFALVPALAGLGVQLSDIGQHVFEASKAETDALKKQYEKVGKSIDDVSKGVKSVINLVETIDRLTAAKTADNAEVASLMRQGVEAAYEVLLAKLKVEQADLTLAARTAQVASDTALLATVQAQVAQLKADQKVFVQAGRSAIRTTQRRVDALLTIAFRAERSVEIYTLKDETQRVSFDSGYVHPDVDHDFDEGDISAAELASAYTTSWLKFLNPLGLRDDYNAYFSSDHQFDLAGGVIVASISDTARLDAFRDKKAVSFNIGLDDVPADQFEVKVEALHVALVGAHSTKSVLNVTVRHGGRYLMLARGGGNADQLLEPHITNTIALFTPLQVTGTPVSSGSSQQFNLLSFWGRGVGGEWEIAVDERNLAADQVSLAGLSEIQLWIATQAFIPVN